MALNLSGLSGDERLRAIAERNANLGFGTITPTNNTNEYSSLKNDNSFSYARTPQFNADGTEKGTGTNISSVGAAPDTKVDEASIRADIMKQQQARIDAVNQVYSQLRAEEARKQEAVKTESLGRTRATQARGGLIGSSFGTAQTLKTTDLANQSAKAADELLAAKQNDEIQSIYGDIDAQTQKKAEAEYARKKGDLETWNTKLKEARTQAQTLLGYSGASGVTFDEYRTKLGEEAFRQLLDNAGLDETSARGLFETGKAEFDVTKGKSGTTAEKPFVVSPGASIFDPTTGKFLGTAPEKPADPSKPITAEVGNTLLQYDPASGTWESIYTAPEKASADNQKIVKIDGEDYVQNSDGSYTKPTLPTGSTAEKAEKAGNIVSKINSLLATDDWRAGVGPISSQLPEWASGKRNTALANIEEIISSLALENLNLLKGPMSDKDIMFIKDASAGLRTSMDEKSFKKKIESIRDKMVEVQNKATQQNTTTLMMGPDGIQYNVPNDQVESFIKDGGKRFNNVDGDTNPAIKKVISKASSTVDNTKGGQCGAFVRKVTGIRVGDSYGSKLAAMDPSIKEPKPGMVFVLPYKSTGHIGIILDVKDGIATVKHSNYDLNEKITTDQIPVSKMTGFTYPKIS